MEILMYTLLNFAKGGGTVFITTQYLLCGKKKVPWD